MKLAATTGMTGLTAPSFIAAYWFADARSLFIVFRGKCYKMRRFTAGKLSKLLRISFLIKLSYLLFEY